MNLGDTAITELKQDVILIMAPRQSDRG